MWITDTKQKLKTFFSLSEKLDYEETIRQYRRNIKFDNSIVVTQKMCIIFKDAY